jgi:hypothetical protein
MLPTKKIHRAPLAEDLRLTAGRLEPASPEQKTIPDTTLLSRRFLISAFDS